LSRRSALGPAGSGFARQTRGVPNRLAAASSPYLLQHADNPVDWWEWGDEAFAEARRRDVPIFLSIGYSACHWCHVMAHESFEDPAIADVLNANFVSVKVDREERPDVDSVYMDATTALTGHGGWPMSVFLDHEGRPFYAGTYFPPDPRHGLPSFAQILDAISSAWTQRREEVEGAAGRIVQALAQRGGRLAAESDLPDAQVLDNAVETLASQYDEKSAGFGSAPKFPPSMLLDFLARYFARTGNPGALVMLEGTCTAMARGGIYDQLGGGFARYAVDRDWVVPHFEKMLYDNALLLRAYTRWWRLTRSPLAERVIRETAEFLLRDLRTAEGGFASALDADSEGEEGIFYSWTPAQLVEVLGETDGQWVAELCSVTQSGTFEHGTSTLQLRNDPDDADRWRRCRDMLFQARELRVHPGRDDKVIAAWNGMTISALAEAGAALGEPEWIEAAAAAGDLLISLHLGAGADGDRLIRTSKDGRVGTTDGVLEDYACVADGFIRLYSVTGDDSWLAFAGVLLDVVREHFSDGQGGFFDTADDAESLVIRPRDPVDNATPSGWLAAAQALLDYSALSGSAPHRSEAERALGVVAPLAVSSPRAVGMGLAVAESFLDGPREIALVGDYADDRMLALLQVAMSGPALCAVTAVATPGEESGVALLQDRSLVAGAPAAYVCRHFTCERPVTQAEELLALLHRR
jgi:uncharacterized protein YyaL (SSP411 family)